MPTVGGASVPIAPLSTGINTGVSAELRKIQQDLTALEDRINALEIQKKLLTCNYFNKKEELE